MTRSLSGSFWPKNRYLNWTIHHIRQFGPVRLLVIPKTEDRFEGPQFSDIADIQGHATTILKSISEEEFQKCFEQRKHRLTKCTGAQGDYFEGNSNH
jgi:hypothetical protein